MICYHDRIEKHDLGKGVIVQVLGVSEKMNVLHWNMADGSEVTIHKHAEEQFGFIIRGQLDLIIEGKLSSCKQGDGYFIPSNALHSFVAVGETEAIDVFTPIKKKYDNPRIDEILAAAMAKQ